ncbi:hypothetical protein E4U41_005389 [Claviceps citrina]|nr:hypothetical protein E4U41_005389 [Claviceps citrina]
MTFPAFGITAVSLTACIHLVFVAGLGLSSRMLLVEVFAGVWTVAALAVTAIPHDGLIRYFWYFNRERVLVSSSKGLAEVLVTNSYQFKRPDTVGRLLKPVLGAGLLLTEGDVHKVQRRNLMPAFAFRHVKDLYPVFWSKAREVVQAMTSRAAADDGVAHLDAQDWADRCTLDIIGVAGLGVDFGSIRDPGSLLAVTYRSLMEGQTCPGIASLMQVLLPAWMAGMLPTRRNQVVDRASRVLRRACGDIIRDKKEKKKKEEEERGMTADDGARSDLDILSVALESGLFSDENLIDQLMTFLAAGHETTASALTWATYLLACHPDKQTRLRGEIHANLPPLHDDNDGPDKPATSITSADIDGLPYLNAVCNEVLRVFAPVPRTSREAIQDTTIQGQHIPKGTVVSLSPWATNVDPSLWGSDAMDFRPERWLADGDKSGSGSGGGGDRGGGRGGATSNYAFLTFLHGPRSCIGASFARAELACLLAAWVGRFEFELRDRDMMDPEKLAIRFGVTARPRGGLHVKARVVAGF